VVVNEQCVEILPEEMKVWVKKRKPKTTQKEATIKSGESVFAHSVVEREVGRD